MLDEELSNLAKWFRTDVLAYPEVNEDAQDYCESHSDSNFKMTKTSTRADTHNLPREETEAEAELSLIEFITGTNDIT